MINRKADYFNKIEIKIKKMEDGVIVLDWNWNWSSFFKKKK